MGRRALRRPGRPAHRAARPPAAALQRVAGAGLRRQHGRRHRARPASPPRAGRGAPRRPAPGRGHPRPRRPRRRVPRVRAACGARGRGRGGGRGRPDHAGHRPLPADGDRSVPGRRLRPARAPGRCRPDLGVRPERRGDRAGRRHPGAARRGRRRSGRPSLRGAPPARPLPRQHRALGADHRHAVLGRRDLRRSPARRARRLRRRGLPHDHAPPARRCRRGSCTAATSPASAASASSTCATGTWPGEADRGQASAMPWVEAKVVHDAHGKSTRSQRARSGGATVPRSDGWGPSEKSWAGPRASEMRSATESPTNWA